MEGPDRLLESILRVRTAGDREIDLTRGFRRLGTRIGARPRLDRQSEETGGDQKHVYSLARHGDI